MNLTRYNPIAEVAPAARRRSPLFGLQPFEDLFDRLFENAVGGSELPGDFLENDERYELRFDLPGFPRESIQLSVEGDALKIEANVGEQNDSRRRTFRQVLSLPERVNRDGISAQAKDGVLTVRLPKTEEHKPRSITVE